MLPIMLLVSYIIIQLQLKINARCLDPKSLKCASQAGADPGATLLVFSVQFRRGRNTKPAHGPEKKKGGVKK